MSKAATVPLSAIVKRAVDKRNVNLEDILTKSKLTLQFLFSEQYFKLFPNDTVNTDTTSWDTRLLCIVICLLFASDLLEAERDAITCIIEQRNDLDNYMSSAILDYKTYETKWSSLREALLEMLTTSNSKVKYECKRLIQSFAKEPIQVNMSLINKLKENKDITEQIKMAVEYKVSRIFSNGDDALCEIKGGTKDVIMIDEIDKDVHIIQGLQDITVRKLGELILECRFTKPHIPVRWLKNHWELEPNNRTKIFSRDCLHKLTVADISEEDSAVYTCTAGNVKTECCVKVEGADVQIIQDLQNLTVKESEALILECKFTSLDTPVKWLKNLSEVVPNNRIKICSGDSERLVVNNTTKDDSAVYTCIAGNVRSECYVKVTELPRWFTSKLQSADVYANESIVLGCELNTEIEAVKWFKFSDQLAEREHVSFRQDGQKHYLEISAGGLDDTGIQVYSCLSGDTLTSTYVNVKVMPVAFIENLTDKEVPEGDDITLTCEVDVLKMTPIWFHDDKKIQNSCVRRSISSHGRKHKLTILNAKLYDDGKYRVAFGKVSSEAILTVKDTTSDLHKQQLTKQNYRNWVRGALSLLYLKKGLTGFSNKCMMKQHYELMQKLPTSAVQCTHCNMETLMPFRNHANNKTCYRRSCLCLKKSKSPQKRAVCPNGGFCSKLYDLILAEHRHTDPCLANADIPTWNSDPWSVGTCFVNTPGYKNKKSAQEIDCSGLLSVFINDKFFNTELGDVRINGKSDLFKQARDARNDILHNPNYELSESELNKYIDLFRDVLDVRNAVNKKPLENEPGVPEALQHLKRLQSRQLDIDEEVNRTINTIEKQETVDLLEKAKKGMEEKVNLLEEKVKEKEEQIQFLRQIRHSERTIRKQQTRFEVVFDLTIMLSCSLKAKRYKDKILKQAKDAIQSQGRRKPSKSPLALTMETLVDSLNKIPSVRINLADGTEPTLKVKVTSYDGLNGFLTLMNGKVLRQNFYQLRKRIEKDIGEAVVVNARITSDNFTKAQLSSKGISHDTHGEFKCKSHPWMHIAWYCTEHDAFCCTICKTNEHRSCEGLDKVISELTEVNILAMKEKTEYNVRISGVLNHDKEHCNITGMCVLPDLAILLVDYRNNRLKKLDSSLKLVSYCVLPDAPWDVCYIGNDVAAVSVPSFNCLQFVNVSGYMKLKHKVMLTFNCRSLASHGDTLYVTSRSTDSSLEVHYRNVYTCKTDGTKGHLLYSCDCHISSIAVSDEGEKIYLATTFSTLGGLVTIDNEGNHLSYLRMYEKGEVENVCTIGDGTVCIKLASNENCVVQVDYKGERVLGTIFATSDNLKNTWSLCFDRYQCRLIVGYDGYDKISVFQLK